MHKNAIEYILDLNKKHSQQFCASEDERQQYRRRHPTEIGVLKCMDGRVHMAAITDTPLGIIQPWRTMGGKFDLGHNFFQETLREWYEFAGKIPTNAVLVVTYHFSRSEEHLGCRGFNYDTHAAEEYARQLKSDLDEIYESRTLHTVVWGIETDLDAIIVHGDNGERTDLSECAIQTRARMSEMFSDFYPTMPAHVVKDLANLAYGNLAHIELVRHSRTLDKRHHNESVLVLGRGVDWLHAPNLALIVGPFHYDLSEVVETAAGVLLDNLKNNRTPYKEVVAMAVAPYRLRRTATIKSAEKKAQSLARYMMQVIEANKNLQELVPCIKRLTGTVDMANRRLHVLHADH